ncbi:MAG: hypothetical protein IAE82_19160 [Opitutaceae bacterium]|nr:hypothetical protein [Opitutaceae bacterium]
MNATTYGAPFRDRLDRLVFRGDRVRNIRTGLEYIVNNIVSAERLDAVRVERGVSAMASLPADETELLN